MKADIYLAELTVTLINKKAKETRKIETYITGYGEQDAKDRLDPERALWAFYRQNKGYKLDKVNEVKILRFVSKTVHPL